MIVAWIEHGAPDLEFDALRARPSRGAVYGVAQTSAGSAQIVLRRQEASRRPESAAVRPDNLTKLRRARQFAARCCRISAHPMHEVAPLLQGQGDTAEASRQIALR